MVHGLPIKISALRNAFSGANLSDSFGDSDEFEDDGGLEIVNFPKEMREVIRLDEELDRYFQFLSKLSRDELLAILEYEVYNRILIQQGISLPKDELHE